MQFSYYSNGVTQKKPTATFELITYARKVGNGEYKTSIEPLRACAYKGEEYNRQKNRLPIITPAGIFGDERNDQNLVQASGLMYLDIDKLTDSQELEQVKKKLIEGFGDKIIMLGMSCGGRGLFLYIMVKGLNSDNYGSAMDYFASSIFHEFKLDLNVKGICRPHFVSYDPDVYINPLAEELQLPKSLLTTNLSRNDNVRKATLKVSKKGTKCYTSSVEFIQFEKLNLRMKTHVEVRASVVELNPIEYHEIKYSGKIADTTKHRTFRYLTNALVYHNPHATVEEVQSYIFYVNSGCTNGQPMNIKEMCRTVAHEYNRIKNGGQLMLETWVKVVHFNPNYKGGSEAKKEMAAVLNGLIRRLRSADSITCAVGRLEGRGKKLTQKIIATEAGVSPQTVHRNKAITPDMLLEAIESKLDEYNNGEVSDAVNRDEIINEYECLEQATAANNARLNAHRSKPNKSSRKRKRQKKQEMNATVKV